MSVTITLSSITPSTPPIEGWMVEYAIKGTGIFTPAPGSPFYTLPKSWVTNDPAGTLYDIRVTRDCGDINSTPFTDDTPCNCPADYVVSPGGKSCEKVTMIPATVTSSGFCLAASTNGAYGNFGARIYNYGFNESTLFLPMGTVAPTIFADMTSGYWANPSNTPTNAPMNRSGVWIDSDCNGTKDGLLEGTKTTLAYMYNNTGLARTVYIGVGGDNSFDVVVNGHKIVDTYNHGGDNYQFKVWHILPVPMVVGVNYFNVVAAGDGTVNDAMAMIIYDSPPATIRDAGADLDMTILFDSKSLLNPPGQKYDIATCPPNYSMDVSGGTGNYKCISKEVAPCNTDVVAPPYCYAAVRSGKYSGKGTRIYSTNWITATTQQRADALFIGEHGYDPNEMIVWYFNDNALHQWKSSDDGSDTFDEALGPMNRSAIWADTDCDGTSDTPALGATATASINFNNTTSVRWVYLGIGGDNSFTLKQNGIKIVASNDGAYHDDSNFKTWPHAYWHIIPVHLILGVNTFTMDVVNSSDSGDNRAGIAMTLYDNSLAEMKAGTWNGDSDNPIYNVGLNVVRDTINLI
jgi:hypothetical protein